MLMLISNRARTCIPLLRAVRRHPSTRSGPQRESPIARSATNGSRGATRDPVRGPLTSPRSMMCRAYLSDEDRRQQREDECLNERDKDLEEHDEQRHRDRRQRDEPSDRKDQSYQREDDHV